MIYRNNPEMISERLNEKSLDQMFMNIVRKGYECPPFVAEAILHSVKSVFGASGNSTEPKAGQMKVLAISAKEPAGKRISDCELKEVVITIDAGKEDEEIRSKYGHSALRRARLLRIAEEARDSGALLTQEDIAYKILNCGIRTVRRDIEYFRSQGIQVPTRGQQVDIGRGLSHRVAIVKLYLERQTYTDIARTMKHSMSSIKRYVLTFSRVVFLTRLKQTIDVIAFLVQISKKLVKDYQELYQKYNTEEYKDKIEEIVKIGEDYHKLQKKEKVVS